MYSDILPHMEVRFIGWVFIRKFITWFSLYLWGYFNLSPGWLVAPLMLSVIRELWKLENKSSLKNAQEDATSDEKEFVKSRLSDLPSWVYFPDFEKVEWLNRAFKQLWPSVGHLITHLLKTEVEPLIKRSFEKTKFKTFKFEKLTFGNIPPRIGGVKCYKQSHTSRDEIILDLDLTWAGDSTTEVSINRMRASILDLYIVGHLRIVLKPIMHNLPLIGGIQFYFLNPPKIDFAVGGIANVTDLPGVNGLLRMIISEQIARFLVLPNKISVPLCKDIPLKVFKCPEPQGVLRITLVSGKDLMAKDLSLFGVPAASDPYAVLTVGAKEFRSKTIKKNLNPIWKETWEVAVEVVKGTRLSLDVWDANHGTSDDFLGRVGIPISVMVGRGESEMWVTLEGVTSGKVQIKTQWLTLSSDVADYQNNLTELHGLHLSTAVLQVYVDSCSKLPMAKTTKPDPVVQVNVASSVQPQETAAVKYSRNPVYEESFVFLVNNPEVDDLHIVVFDEGSHATLGQLKVNLTTIMSKSDMEFLNQPFKLKNSNFESTITLHLKLHFTKKVLPTKKKSQVDLDYQMTDEDTDQLLQCNEYTTLQHTTSISGGSVESLADIQPEVRRRVIEKQNHSQPDQPQPKSGANILLTLEYTEITETVTVVVHKAVNLPYGTSSSLPDPFVKLNLLPDRPWRRKTEYVLDCCDPQWEETFTFKIDGINVDQKKVEVLVMDRKGLFTRSAELGHVVVEVKHVKESEVRPNWYQLTLAD